MLTTGDCGCYTLQATKSFMRNGINLKLLRLRGTNLQRLYLSEVESFRLHSLLHHLAFSLFWHAFLEMFALIASLTMQCLADLSACPILY